MSIPCLACVRSMKSVEMYMSPEIVLLTGDVLSILLSLHIFSPIRKYSTTGPQNDEVDPVGEQRGGQPDEGAGCVFLARAICAVDEIVCIDLQLPLRRCPAGHHVRHREGVRTEIGRGDLGRYGQV